MIAGAEAGSYPESAAGLIHLSAPLADTNDISALCAY